MNLKKLSFIFGLFGAQFALAQNNNSPYSIVGIGDIEQNYFDRTSGMASAGVAYQHYRYLSHSNPASYVSIEDKLPNFSSITFEVAARYNAVSYAGFPVRNQTGNSTSDAQFKKGAITLKLKKKWAMTFGLLPYSTSNYSFFTTKEIPGSNLTLPTYIFGSGSTNQFFVANSFRLFNKLNVGVQTGWLFGQFAQTEQLQQISISDSVLQTKRNYALNAPFLKAGLIYSKKINKHVVLNLGGTISAQTNLSGDYSINIVSGPATIKDETKPVNNFFNIPVAYNFGACAEFDDNFKVLADYKYQPWQNANQPTSGSYAFANSNRFSVGGEFAKMKEVNANGQKLVFEKLFFQAGFYLANSNLIVNNTQINDAGVSLGFGTNSMKSGLGFALSLQVGSRGTQANKLVQENYTQISVLLSYKDYWSANRKKYF